MVFPAILITGGVSLAGRSGIISHGEISLPYPLFVFLGTLLWQVFAEALDVPHQAFESARSFLTRVNFSRVAIVLAQSYESLTNMLVRYVLALALVAFYVGVDVPGSALMFLCFLGTVILGVGFGVFIAPFTILFSDIHNAVKLFISYGLFLTPALYVPSREGLFAEIVRLNPVSPLMATLRDAAAGSPLTELTGFLSTLAVAIILVTLGFTMIRVAAPILIERMLLGGR